MSLASSIPTGSGLDEHMEESRLAQRHADHWLISGSILIGSAAPGVFGLPLFLRGVWLLRRGTEQRTDGTADAGPR